MLDGSLDFVSTIGSVATVRDAKIDQANLGATGSVTVDVNIADAATQAELTLADTAFSAATAANATSTIAQKTYTLNVGGETLAITGGNDFNQIELVDSDTNAAPSAAFAGGKLTITYDGDGSNNANLGDVVTAINTALPTAGFVLGTPSGVTQNLGPGNALAATDTTATTAGIKITSGTSGADFNNVTVKYVSGAATGAVYDSDAQELTVTVASGNVAFSAIKSAIDATGFTASFTNAAGTATPSYSALVLNLGNQTVNDASTGNTGGQLLKDDLVFELNGKDGSDVFNFQAGANCSSNSRRSQPG